MSKDLMWRRENEKTCNLNQALTHWTQKKVGARVQSALVTFSLGNAMPWTSIQCLIYWSGKCNAACRLQDSCWRNKHAAFQMEDFLPHGSLLGCTFGCRTWAAFRWRRNRRLYSAWGDGKHCSSFVCICELLSKHWLIRLKIFVSQSSTKLCN